MLRSLIRFRRIHAAVVAGAAVGTAVLTGALLVGDSVRGSLRDLSLDRLGRIDSALVARRFFDADLLSRFRGHARFAEEYAAAAPAVVLRGSAVAASGRARASSVGIYGVERSFFSLFDEDGGALFDAERPGLFPPAVLNDVLARELGVGVGDTVLLRFGRSGAIPPDTLMGQRDVERITGSWRVSVAAVVPARGWGRFGLAPRQQSPPDVFVELARLQRALGRPGRINALLLAHRSSAADPDALLRDVVSLQDLGLSLERGEGFFEVRGDEFVLRPHVETAVAEVARSLGAPAMSVQVYLANTLSLGPRLLPYSTVAAVDPPGTADWSSLMLADGTPAPRLGEGEILLNTWAVDDLGARVGDTVRMEYFAVGPREELVEAAHDFRVAGVVAMRGLAGDPRLTPDYPGIHGAADMKSWTPPFPLDLSLIRPRDERYWDEHRAMPKAFVARDTGRRLWSTRHGSTTAVRVGAAADDDLAGTRERFREALLAALSPEAPGLRFRRVKAEGLEAGVGAVDFSTYFLAFSFFLIVSAALLVGLLFALGVERRAREVGLRLAVGFPLRRVRRGLLLEGGVLAVAGGLLGLGLAVGYAAALMLALNTIWRPAVGTSELALHVRPSSLAVGWAAAVAVMLLSILIALGRVARVPPPALLAGSVSPPPRRGGGRLAAALAWGGLTLAAGLGGYAAATGRLDDLALTFGSGAALLVSGLAWFSGWCRRRDHGGVGFTGLAPLAGMAARNAAWSPGRSVLSVALVGTACYVVVVTGAYRHRFGEELRAKDSGAGGFALLAESDVPLHHDLERREDRAELGLSPAESELLEGTRVFSFRLLPGEDASCLNLYRPERPRIVGVPPGFVERGGFRFKTVLGAQGGANPWRVLEAEPEKDVIPAIGDANSMQYILHLKPGQDLVVRNEYGRDVRLRLVGVLQKSVFQSELLISERAFLEHFPSRSGFAYFLVETPFERAGEVGRALEGALEPFGFDATTTRDRLAAFQEVEHTYLSTFQALGGLGLLLGTVGLAIVLVRNVIERRGELAAMRAFGFRRTSLAWIVAAETAFLLLVGVVVGTVAALVSVAPSLAGARVGWASIAGTLVAIVLFGMLSCAVAVRGALRVPLLPTLKAER